MGKERAMELSLHSSPSSFNAWSFDMGIDIYSTLVIFNINFAGLT